MTCKPNYSDLFFQNDQLTKLVKLAESIFENINEGGIDNRKEIDKWLCYKKEFDVCCETMKNDESSNSLKSSKSLSSSESWCSSDEIYTDEDDNECSDEVNFNVTTSGFVSSSPSEWGLDEVARRSRDRKLTFEKKDKLTEKFGNDVVWNRFIEYPYNSIEYQTLMNSQIENLREIKNDLLNVCQNYPSHYKRSDPAFKMNRRVFLIQEVIEMIDASIEIKANAKVLDDKIVEIIESDKIVYSSFLSYSEFLSIKEIQFLFMWYLTRYVDLRENSSMSDRLILSLEGQIIDQNVKLRNAEGDLLKIHRALVSMKNKNKNDLSNRILNLKGVMNMLESKHAVPLLNVATTSTVIAVRGTERVLSRKYDVTQQGNKMVIGKD